jgi:hypothetical protein
MTHEPCWTRKQLLQALDEYERELRESGKTRNTINTYVQHPERFIKWLPSSARTTAEPIEPSFVAPTRWGSKYEGLGQYLGTNGGSSVELTFQQIEEILGLKLPDSARRYPAWWANEKTGSHSHARSWLDAGWKTSRVNLKMGTVKFGRAVDTRNDLGTDRGWEQ